MSSWVTDEKGKWHPAKERVNLKNLSGKSIRITTKDVEGKEFVQEIPPGADYIYEGPCRAALFELWEAHGRPTEEQIKDNPDQLLTLGEGYRTNNEFLEAYGKARQMFGFNSVEEYLKYLGYDEKKVKVRFQEKASVVMLHDAPRRVAEIKKLGGGENRADPREVLYGGFGDPDGFPMKK